MQQEEQPNAIPHTDSSSTTHLCYILPADSFCLPQEEEDTVPEFNFLEAFGLKEAVEGDTAQYVQSVFTNHQLQVKHAQKHEVSRISIDWITGVLIVLLFIFVAIRNQYSTMLNRLIKSVFFQKYERQLFRDGGRVFDTPIIFPLRLLYVLLVALLVFYAADYWIAIEHHVPFPPILIYIGIAVGIWLFMAIKRGLLNLFGNVLEIDKQLKQYFQSNFLLQTLTNIVLLPLLFLYTYTKANTLLYIAVGFFVLYMLFRLVKGIVVCRSYDGVSKIILYFCTLEVLPYLLLVKAATLL